jgi:beta propeller repeat protein
MVNDYLHNGRLTTFKNISPVPSLPQDPSFYPTTQPIWIEPMPSLPALKGTLKKISNESGENLEYPSIWEDRVIWLDRGQIWLYNITTGASEAVVTLKGESHSIPVLYGDTILYSDLRNGLFDIYQYDIQSRTEQVLFSTSSKFGRDNPKISGDTVVYVEDGDVFVYNFDTKIKTRLADILEPYGAYSYFDKKTEFNGFYSVGDGHVIFFGRDRQGNNPTFLYTIDSGALTRMTNDTGIGQYNIASSGDSIAWLNLSNNFSADIYLYNIKSGLVQNITGGSIRNVEGVDPVMFGNVIVAEGKFDQNWSFYVYDTVTGNTYLIPPIPGDPRDNFEPEIWDNRIVWSSHHIRGNRTSEIDLFTFDKSALG